jgi:hypothetical protein
MRLKDITLGEHYAFEKYGTTWRVRADAIEDHTRKVYSGRRSDWGGHQTTQKMVRVTFVKDDGSVAHSLTTDGPRVEHVLPAQLVGTWYSHEVMAAAQRSYQQRVEDSLAALEERVLALTGERVYFARRTSGDGRVGAGQAVISASQLEKIIARLTESSA